MTVGAAILKWMHEDDRTMGHLARKSGLEADRLIAIITGQSRPLDVDRESLAAVMGVEPDQLAQWDDRPALADVHPLRCYTVREVSELMNVSEDTVRKEIARGTLRHIVVGERAKRIPHTALEWRLAL